jgi:hypothetical protein
MIPSRYALARTTTVLAASSMRLAPSLRKPRRKRKGTVTPSSQSPVSDNTGSGGERSVPLNTAAADATAAVGDDMDEVERLLAATSTQRNGSRLSSTRSGTSAADVTGVNTLQLCATAADAAATRNASMPADASSSPSATAAPPTLDSATALHLKAVHQATIATTRGVGPTHAQLEQIERRRSKPSLAEAEFDVGVTERLVPELSRLPALHELHYGDAVVREVDRSLYFAQQHQQHKEKKMPMKTTSTAVAVGYDVAGVADNRHDAVEEASKADAEAAAAPTTVVIGGESYVELSLDGDLTEADFEAFDAEAATKCPSEAAAAPSSNTTPTTATVDSATAAPAPSAQVCAVAAHEDPGMAMGEGDDVADIDVASGAVVAMPLSFGTTRPWFVPPSGVVQLEPLPPRDCALLLRFLLYLRQQTEADLVPTLRRALQWAEAEECNRGHDTTSSDGVPRRHALTLADVICYLDTAPPPVIGFTESLPSSRYAADTVDAASTTKKKPAAPSSTSATFATPAATSPAFVFHLYTENISSQNAIGHLATFFGLPQRCFQTHSAASKMSCTTVLCAVAENRMRREHLLLLNTLRHPGFVLRVSTIQEVPAERYTPPADAKEGNSVVVPSAAAAVAATTTVMSVSQQLFGELARWQPLYQAELLLRRVCSDKTAGSSSDVRQQLEQRLRAVQTVGAICFCANREASLARAATDVLHGFFKSALLNALHRRKAPAPVQRFLKRPNAATAQHAHHVSTDPTVRQVLKTFVHTNGDWHETVVRTPYVWRRRWINALRGLVWNTMASRRLRKAGRDVCVGDVVLKPEFRHDVHRRGVVTVKAEHVMVVRTAAEAAAASLEDVFIPFLRGRYPEHLFAAEDTQHPIMTRTNMLALLRSMHAPQLLLGMTDELRLLLDVRAASSPLLFRRLIVRPVEMEFTILEDKPPMKALHYDAARLLTNDRWAVAATEAGASASSTSSGTRRPSAVLPQHHAQTDTTGTGAASSPPPALCGTSHLLPPSEVLERTTLGARLTSGVLPEDFFAIPRPDDYVVLGHAHRHLAGDFVPAAPHSNTADVGDRVFTVYVRAVVEYNVAGLSNILREYFLLSGIETESESALQHKVHRLRRELDRETPLLTAPVYCTTCFNRDHDTQEQCAEYQYKLHRRAAHHDIIAATSASLSLAGSVGSAAGAISRGGGVLADTHAAEGHSEETAAALRPAVAAIQPAASTTTYTVRMRWHLRRRNDEQRWGVHLTKSLQLVGVEDVQLLREGAIWSVDETAEQRSLSNSDSGGGGVDPATAAVMSLPDATQSAPWPSSWITEAAGTAPPSSPSHGIIPFLQSIFQPARTPIDGSDAPPTTAVPAEALQNLLLQSPVLMLPRDPPVLQLRKSDSATTAAGKTTGAGPAVWKACPWTLKLVNATPVSTQRDVAAALLQPNMLKSRDVWLTFEVTVPEFNEAVPLQQQQQQASTAPRWVPDAWLHSTHPADRIPQSTAALPPKRRHEVEASMLAAVQCTSEATQRWLRDLPYRLTLVLVKHHRHVHKCRSWGLQLDGTDMTLLNFARLMVQYMYVSASPEKGLVAEKAMVASLAPAASFPRNDREITARLLTEVLPGLEPLLNDMYRVVRINNTPVHHKAEAARAMATFQADVDGKVANGKGHRSAAVVDAKAQDGATAAAAAAAKDVGKVPEQFFLTLTLERKASSYRLCAAQDLMAGASSSPVTAAAGTTSEQQPTSLGKTGGERSSRSEADAATRAAAALQVDTTLLDGLATPHCPVRPLTPLQLTRSSVVVAINRLVLTEQTRGKWGLRLQHGTRRLKAIQQNRAFSFHVFAAKQSQGTRIADTLRLVPARRTTPPDTAAASENAVVGSTTTTAAAATSTHVITRSFYLYYIEGVNQVAVRSHAELRRQLFIAAQPVLASSLDASGARAGSSPVPATVVSLPPESVTLSVRQLPLLRFSATVRRGGVGEGSALGPVGLQVDRNMRVLSIFAGSPMARALTEAVGPLCSARRLMRERSRSDTSAACRTADDNNNDDGGSAEPPASVEWEVVALPHLRPLLARVEAGMLLRDAVSGHDALQQQQQWVYDMDEDEMAPWEQAASREASVSAQTNSSEEAAAAKDKDEEKMKALRALADAAAHTLQQLGRCSMVDGVHVLQTSLLHEYALKQLAALRQGRNTKPTAPEKEKEDDDDDDGGDEAGLATLKAQLSAVYDQLRWEVVYAAQINRPLRTPADLAAAFAPGVAEETISVQQFVED